MAPADRRILDEGLTLDFRNLGSTGLKRYGGLVREEFLPQLEGQNAARIYREMTDNDAICGGIVYAIDRLVRRVPWRVQAASTRPADRAAAEFIESCMHDMSMTWIDTVSEILSMIVYGYSFHEIVYKRRAGNALEKSLKSKYRDGRIGWRYLPIRSQDTIWRWHFDESGDVIAAEQLAPPLYRFTIIPMAKAMLFRCSVHKNNPEGRSIFRQSYASWWKKKNLENIEAVGIERDLAGLPIAFVPPEYLSPNANAKQKAILGMMQEIVVNVRRDEQEGIVFPMLRDDKGNPLFDFKLLSAGGQRQFDVDKTIQRYNHSMAASVQADFLLMGQSSSTTGSNAMHVDKTAMFEMSIASILDIIASQFNDHGIPRLLHLNSFPITDYPTIEHADIEQTDIKELAAYITALSAAGMPLFPNPTLEKYLYEVAKMPSPIEDLGPGPVEAQINPPPPSQKDVKQTELHDRSSLEHAEPDLGSATDSLGSGSQVRPIAVSNPMSRAVSRFR